MVNELTQIYCKFENGKGKEHLTLRDGTVVVTIW